MSSGASEETPAQESSALVTEEAPEDDLQDTQAFDPLADEDTDASGNTAGSEAAAGTGAAVAATSAVGTAGAFEAAAAASAPDEPQESKDSAGSSEKAGKSGKSDKKTAGTKKSEEKKSDIASAPESEEDTQAFTPITPDVGDAVTRPVVTPAHSTAAAVGAGAGAASATTATATLDAKPASFTDQEWALISGTAAGTVPPPPGATAREVVLPERRYRFIDVLGIILTTVLTPFVLLALAVRLIASGAFLRFEYFLRPGFPADTYGFTSADRLHYGSYVVDYLNNLDSSRYLSDVVLPNGVPVFTTGEISHMADVKSLVSLLYLIGVVGFILVLVFMLIMSRASGPGIHLAVRLGAIFTLVAGIGVAVLALTGWDDFFTSFHQMFFSSGTWQFYLDDSLIRLFPGAFWTDSAIAVGAIVGVIALLAFILSFSGAKKRKALRKS